MNGKPDRKHVFARHTIHEDNDVPVHYDVTLENISLWIFNIFRAHIKYLNQREQYKDIEIVYEIVPYSGGHILIHWKHILVVDCLLYSINNDIVEFHYGETWIKQFIEYYEQEYGKREREHLKQKAEEIIEKEKERTKRFEPLEDGNEEEKEWGNYLW